MSCVIILEDYDVQHIETQSILDLFSRLNQLQTNENTWLIVDHSGDSEALLKEIRHRYQRQFSGLWLPNDARSKHVE